MPQNSVFVERKSTPEELLNRYLYEANSEQARASTMQAIWSSYRENPQAFTGWDNLSRFKAAEISHLLGERDFKAASAKLKDLLSAAASSGRADEALELVGQVLGSRLYSNLGLLGGGGNPSLLISALGEDNFPLKNSLLTEIVLAARPNEQRGALDLALRASDNPALRALWAFTVEGNLDKGLSFTEQAIRGLSSPPSRTEQGKLERIVHSVFANSRSNQRTLQLADTLGRQLAQVPGTEQLQAGVIIHSLITARVDLNSDLGKAKLEQLRSLLKISADSPEWKQYKAHISEASARLSAASSPQLVSALIDIGIGLLVALGTRGSAISGRGAAATTRASAQKPSNLITMPKYWETYPRLPPIPK